MTFGSKKPQKGYAGRSMNLHFHTKKIFSGVSISCTVPPLFLPLLIFQALACSAKDNIRVAYLILLNFLCPMLFHFYETKQKSSMENGAAV